MSLIDIIDHCLDKVISGLGSSVPQSPDTRSTSYKFEGIFLIVGLLLMISSLYQTAQITQQAKINFFISKISSVQASWQIFTEHFEAIPGDFPFATVHISSNLLNGNANGVIDTAQEQQQAWRHLFSSGAIKKESQSYEVYYTHNTFGQILTFDTMHMENQPPANILVLGNNIPYRALMALEAHIDDGKLTEGHIQLNTNNSPSNTNQNLACQKAQALDSTSKELHCSAKMILPGI